MKLIIGYLIFFSTYAHAQDLKCRDFKNGKFEIIDTETGNSIIERKGSKQIEYGGRSDLKLEFKVKWLNECTYTLELKKIIKTKQGSYIQETSSNMYDMVLKGEIFKIE